MSLFLKEGLQIRSRIRFYVQPGKREIFFSFQSVVIIAILRAIVSKRRAGGGNPFYKTNPQLESDVI
jgi:hypothetical protein